MARVQLSIEAAPGLRLNVDRDQEDFHVIIGRFAVDFRDGTISVGEYAQLQYMEKPLLRIVTS